MTWSGELIIAQQSGQNFYMENSHRTVGWIDYFDRLSKSDGMNKLDRLSRQPSELSTSWKIDTQIWIRWGGPSGIMIFIVCISFCLCSLYILLIVLNTWYFYRTSLPFYSNMRAGIVRVDENDEQLWVVGMV